MTSNVPRTIPTMSTCRGPVFQTCFRSRKGDWNNTMTKKNNSLKATPPLSVIRGQQVDAGYTEQEIPEYQGNPLLEVLPPLWPKEEVAQLLSYYPYYNAQQRTLSDEVRLHLIENCREFFIPWGIHLNPPGNEKLPAVLDEMQPDLVGKGALLCVVVRVIGQ